MNTHLIYLENLTVLSCAAQVIDILHDGDKTIVILDKTVFYPQGGGQPYDTGTIENVSGKFLVKEVRFVDGVVRHSGIFEHGSFASGDTVQCVVNQERRALHSRLHSAGHVIDMAVETLSLGWIAGKAYHFPEGPYVEYAGSLEGVDKEALLQKIQDACREILKTNFQTKLLFMPKSEMSKICKHVPDFIPEDKPGRVVMYGAFGIPCGGTHVLQAADLQDITIRKIKSEKGAIRVSYDVPR